MTITSGSKAATRFASPIPSQPPISAYAASAVGSPSCAAAVTAGPSAKPGAAHRQVPPLVAARLGPEAGLVGAAELARRAQPRR